MPRYKRLPSDISRDRERVSVPWYNVLMVLRARGVKFNVNEGHRTMARQAQLVREMGRYPYGKAGYGTGAAAPSSTAPHIRVGRIDHAIDAEPGDRVVAELRRLGIDAVRPMSKEPWHIEAPADDLRRVSDKRKRRFPRIKNALKKRAKYKGLWKKWRKRVTDLRRLKR